MGNLHFVTQLKPQVHIDGAAIMVREDKSEQARRVFARLETSYLYWRDSRHRFSIQNTNIDNTHFTSTRGQRAFVVIGSGGKWGYDEVFRKALDALAPYLEDALVCIDDQYGTGIQELSFHQGEFRHGYLPDTCDTLHKYIRQTWPQDTGLLTRYCLERARDLLSHEDGEYDPEYEAEFEPIQALLKQVTDIDAQNIEGHFLRARYHYLKQDHIQALGQIDKAIDLRGREVETRYWGTDDALIAFERDEDGGIAAWFRAAHDLRGLILWRAGRPREALEGFRQAQRFTPTLGDQLALNHEAVMLISLGEHEQAEAALSELIRSATEVGDLARGYYNRACLRARTENIQAAREDLKLAITLDDYNRLRYRDDTDLAALHHEKF